MVNTQQPDHGIEAQEPDVEAHVTVRNAIPDDDTEGHVNTRF